MSLMTGASMDVMKHDLLFGGQSKSKVDGGAESAMENVFKHVSPKKKTLGNFKFVLDDEDLPCPWKNVSNSEFRGYTDTDKELAKILFKFKTDKVAKFLKKSKN